MAIVKCPNNHYYDDQKNASCTYCAKLESGRVSSDDFNEQYTSYIVPDDYDEGAVMTEAYGEDVEEYEKTIGIFTDPSNNILTAGWLVCMTGAEKGKSYVIASGRNFAGRSLDMDIVITGDPYVSREKHFSIVYDPKQVSFYLISGEGPVYLNEEPVIGVKELKDGDYILIGSNEYAFVPFCKKGREWYE